MTFATGDRGQRYQIEAENYPNPGVNVIGWTNNYEQAQRMRASILQAQGCTAATVVDRQPVVQRVAS